MNGAQALIESLKLEGVERMFGYAGATICPAVDALATSGIGYTLVRTEQNAGHMASGYARVTGKVGVCMVTSGPGATNLITGIATAHMDSIAMVAITGQVPSHLLGRDIFQEVDITGAVAPFSKHSYLVKEVNDIPRVVKEAFYIASTGRPGPVLIDIPIDVQNMELDGEFNYPKEVNIAGYKPSVRGNDLQVKRAAEAISQAKQPVICAGGGVFLSHAENELQKLSKLSGIPVVTTMMGLSLMQSDDSLYMGMIGSHGHKSANKALAKSDLLIMVGTRAADRAILSPNEIGRRMPSIHIDVDPAEIGKNMKAAIPVVGNVKTILQQLLELEPKANAQAWIEWLQGLRHEVLQEPHFVRNGFVTPATALKKLGEALGEGAAVCVDVGQNQIWACKHLPLKRNVRLLTSGGLGTMGYALPAAIGVKTAEPKRQAVVICGDGSFQMAMNELAAVKAAGMDIKIVLFRNNVLGLVNQIQSNLERYPSGPFGVSLDGSPDFVKLAAAYNIPAFTVIDDSGLDGAIESLLGEKGSAMLILNISPEAGTDD